MAKVAFVSHAPEDAAIAASISDYLERNGVSCWIAPRDVTPRRDHGAESFPVSGSCRSFPVRSARFSRHVMRVRARSQSAA